MRRPSLAALVVVVACSHTPAPPAPPIVDPIKSPTPLLTLQVTGSAEFGSTVKIVGGVAPVQTTADPYTARWSVQVQLAAGANTLSVTATDSYNQTSKPTVVDITQGPFGTTPPFTIALELAQPSAFVSIPLGFTVIAVDANGVPADQSTLAITTTDPLAVVSLANHTITFGTPGNPGQTITATLFGGTANQVSASVSLFVQLVSNQPPTVAITSPTASSIFPTDFTVTVRASDAVGLAQIWLQANGSGVAFLQQQLVPLDPTTGKPPVGPFTTTFVVPVPGGSFGPVQLVAQAVDVLGHANTSLAVTVIVDPAVGIIVGAGITVSTVALGANLRRPQGLAVDAANKIYVTNNNSNFPLVVKIDPAMMPPNNQTVFTTAQPGHNGEDLVFATVGANSFFFITTSGADLISRVDAAGTNLVLGWSANVGQTPRGIIRESATTIAAIYNDRRVRRFSSAAAGPNTASTTSMDASANLAGAWGLELLSFTGCTANQFQCANANCISNALVCSGVDRCGDNSDNSATTCAGAATFKCASGAVASTAVTNICNGIADCADASDEAFCNRYAATDNGVNDQAFSFYDDGNAAPTAFDLRLSGLLNQPEGIRLSPSGRFVYIASVGAGAIFQVRTSDILARTPCVGGCPAVATGFTDAWGLVFDSTGDLLVSDRANDVIFRIHGLP